MVFYSHCLMLFIFIHHYLLLSYVLIVYLYIVMFESSCKLGFEIKSVYTNFNVKKNTGMYKTIYDMYDKHLHH